MKRWLVFLAGTLLLCGIPGDRLVAAGPSSSSLVVVPETREVRVSGVIYPMRFNAAQGEEARYHLLVWQGGTSANALIETPTDDLAFHDALIGLGGQPGNNLTMAAWTERNNQNSPASQAKVIGSRLDVRISWDSNPTGTSLDLAFRRPPTPDPQPPILTWRFGGNRARWFNRVPFAQRPGCLACLYSCPSGKVSNGALSIHDYVASPTHFYADTVVLPPDGTRVIVTFRVLP